MTKDEFNEWLGKQDRSKLHIDQVIGQAGKCINAQQAVIDQQAERIKYLEDKLGIQSNGKPKLRVPRASLATKLALILTAVARDCGVTPEAIDKSTRRSRPVAHARHIYVWLLMEMIGLPSVDVGRRINRNHSSVLWGKKQVEQAIRAKLPLGQRARRLWAQLEPMILGDGDDVASKVPA